MFSRKYRLPKNYRSNNDFIDQSIDIDQVASLMATLSFRLRKIDSSKQKLLKASLSASLAIKFFSKNENFSSKNATELFSIFCLLFVAQETALS